MTQTRYKDITIVGKVYRINRLSAQVGSWVTYEIATNGGKLPHGSFTEVQEELLCNVQMAQDVDGTQIFKPIFVRESKVWVDKELEFDLVSVTQLIMESLRYNFESFFQDSRIKEALGMLGLST